MADIFKVCPKCKRRLPATNEYFARNKSGKYGLNAQCKECKIEYAKRHYTANRDRILKRVRKYSLTIDSIYSQIYMRAKKQNLSICSKQEFTNWYSNQKRECTYCNVPERLLALLCWAHGKRRINRLTIDRKDNDIGYSLGNMCLACSVCNMAKNDSISFDEMRIIGESVKCIWKNRFKGIENKSQLSE